MVAVAYESRVVAYKRFQILTGKRLVFWKLVAGESWFDFSEAWN